jgi:hypothetical protein
VSRRLEFLKSRIIPVYCAPKEKEEKKRDGKRNTVLDVTSCSAKTARSTFNWVSGVPKRILLLLYIYARTTKKRRWSKKEK